MNILIILGLIVSFGGVVFGFMVDGGVLSSLVKISSMSIVFGGSIGFGLVSYPMSFLREIPAALKLMLFGGKRNYAKTIDQLVEIGKSARAEGMLVLESKAQDVKDPLIKKGLLLISDGVEPEYLKRVLDHTIEATTSSYERAAKVFEGIGGASPAMGVLGTVMGMVSILREMGTDMDALGAKIATAFIATMYGVGSANLLWLPLGNNIKLCAAREQEYYEMVVEGLMSILEGENPSKMKENLLAMAGNAKDKSKGAGKGDSKDGKSAKDGKSKEVKPAKDGKSKEAKSAKSKAAKT